MSVKARINNQHELLLAGILTENENNIQLDKNGNLKVESVYTEVDSFNDSELVDDENELDDTHQIDDTKNMSVFLAWFFGIGITKEQPNRVMFLDGKYVVANDIKQNQNL